LAYKLKGLDQIILITDSMRACALGDGVSELGGQKVFVQGQQATLADGTIAGSVLTLDRALANFKTTTGLTVPEVVQTGHPESGPGIRRYPAGPFRVLAAAPTWPFLMKTLRFTPPT
jgi:hypothetical protein